MYSLKKMIISFLIDAANTVFFALVLVSPYLYFKWDQAPRVWVILPFFIIGTGTYFSIRMKNTTYYIVQNKYVIIKIFEETVKKIAIEDILYMQSDYIVSFKGRIRNVSEIYIKDDKKIMDVFIRSR